ncbi:MAG: aminoglycoside 6-adenylyltransferase [Chloroflexi bacterium]|nr:aminoglycoside 6-adenylyltransferase [Chloroflexota bacterium]
MRSEQEMLNLILTTAREDERIRAVIMNGSRTVSGASHTDPFQDFDIIYLVKDPASFRADPAWIDRFGERMILQMPDDMGDQAPDPHDRYACLMQFMDGNRIDLTIFPADRRHELYDDSQTIVLLDKDGMLEPFPPPSNDSYLPKPPTAKQFSDCCNEFWWVCPYVAKGLWREQIFYAKRTLDKYLREELDKMVVWYIGIATDYKVSAGSGGKYIPKYLQPELWELYQQTWSGADYGQAWNALLAMGELFRRCALDVAGHFGYEYPYQDDRRVSAHLLHVRALPKNAKEIY